MQHDLKNCITHLKNGGLILYPTDTVWGIGCDASNPEAVEKVYQLKQREDSKALICLVSDTRMLQRYVDNIPEIAEEIINISTSPTTIIYEKAKNLAQNLIAADQSIAIRVPDNDFCYWLCRKLNGALVSTSANISGAPTPKSFAEISPEILKGVDYVVNLHQDKVTQKSSSIIKLKNNGEVSIIRK